MVGRFASVPFRTCTGLGLVVATPVGRDGLLREAAQSPGLALASMIAEREAELGMVSTVVLRMGSRDDACWAEPGLEWIATHGRRPILRSAVVMPRRMVTVARETQATVMLELADHRADVQAALVGRGTDPAAALLLQAQHLRASGVPVGAHLGPLLPGLHDDARVIAPLFQHLAAADVRHVHPSVGQLGMGRLHNLERVLSVGELAGLLRSFGIDARQVAEASVDSTWKLEPAAHLALYQSVSRMARRYGLVIDACGCPAQCRLDPAESRIHVPVAGPELFAS